MDDPTSSESTPLGAEAGRLARIAEVTSEVSARLRGVCAGLPEDVFAALVRQIAQTTVKYETLADARVAREDQGPQAGR